MMKKVLTLLFFLSLLQCVHGATNLRVSDIECVPNPVMSGEWFHLYATVENLSDEPVDTTIFLRVRTAPDGFWSIDAIVADVEISLPPFGKESIDLYDCFVGDDERLELFFITEEWEQISEFYPLQLGECGDEITRVEIFPEFIGTTIGVTDPAINSILAWVYPGSAPQQVTWVVENPEVLTITEYYERGDQGIIFEPTAVGETDVTVIAANGMSATCHVTVTDPVRAESITLNTYEIRGNVGDTFQLEAYTLPENNDSEVIFFTPSDKVATVGATDGLVTITGTGTTEVYAWATPSVGFVQAICKVIGGTSAITETEADTADDLADVFSLDGSLIVKAAAPDRINELPRGCYILRYPNKTVKIIR